MESEYNAEPEEEWDIKGAAGTDWKSDEEKVKEVKAQYI